LSHDQHSRNVALVFSDRITGLTFCRHEVSPTQGA
jgi:hypothetical protein